MFKAVLFDMDGVIVDTEPLHHSAYHEMFKDVNIEVSDDLYASFTGQSTFTICEQLIAHFNLPLSPHTLVDIKRDHFKYLFEHDKSLALIDGVLDLIKDYHSNGMTLVLASSASMVNINRIFERFDLNQYFKAKISGADLVASKPHPEIFIKAAELSEHKPDECFVIEDSTNGIVAAKSANIFCIAFNSPHSKGQDYSKANVVIENFSEITYNKLSDLLSAV
ncbi:HAD family hydrolase [Psychroserpens ponticola]|uniref:HAD family phosphatase n=1 Tax=Psychroserpens ponticola TaxID=2932268 RepID=A0ABY7S300_9FLAO|nr:HAD family phosphatase [Psychroserpens ponticola]WCO02836.1 HAD family phosphatase [Psychroserpens ponticola]